MSGWSSQRSARTHAASQVREEQRAREDRQQDQGAAERRRALLLLVRVGRVFAHVADAVLAEPQPADEARADEDADDERGGSAGDDAEGRVAKKVEPAARVGVFEPLVEEVEHYERPSPRPSPLRGERECVSELNAHLRPSACR